MVTSSSTEPSLTLERIRHPDHNILVMLEGYDREAFGPTGLRTYDLAVVAEAGAVYVGYLDGDLVGGCQVIRLLDEPDFCYVVGVYIRPGWQGRGLGRRLITEVAHECAKHGVRGLLLTVAPDNSGAIALYRSMGFAGETLLPHFYGEGEDRQLLRWWFPEEGLQGGV